MKRYYFSIDKTFFVVSLGLFFGYSLPAQAITPEEAAAHIGGQQTVCGHVANTYYSCFVSKKPTFLNFSKPYPNQPFSVAIAGNDRDKFDNCPEKLFADKDLCVTGMIEEFRGKPLIKISDPRNIEEQ